MRAEDRIGLIHWTNQNRIGDVTEVCRRNRQVLMRHAHQPHYAFGEWWFDALHAASLVE